MNAYIEMLPRLQAEETLTAITVASLGSGRVKQAESRRTVRDLQRVVRGNRESTVVATSPQDIATALQAAGLTRV